MIFNTLEQILIKFSFIIFFLVTLFSWVKITLYENKTISSAVVGIFLGFLSVTGLCIIRWNLSDHIPLSNLYESSLFLAWSLIFLYLLFKIKIESEWLDAIIAPILLMTTTFSTLGLPKQLQEATALVPALQSNWLMMHVTMMILSYGALLFGSLLAVTLLTLNILSSEKNNSATKEQLFSNPAYVSEKIDELSKTKYSLNFPKVRSKAIQNKTVLVNQIDYWSYRIIGIGFPLLTLGILSGAVWANEAWGSYWNWDPKETWALITWVIFAIYLHIRITKGWNGTKPALVAFLGFFVVWMCYLGVNLLGKGLHSYGWLN
uniref:Cytochrome c biogenesis protein CcsA n=1 Tax=Mesotaenium caldariorum TaxID=31321 RepID=A0A7M2BTW5_9VIRI|nr:cytochrome c biogenesis protein [Mesotaenium caldariorum]